MGLQGQKNLYLLILALSVFAIAYVQAAPNKQTTEITNEEIETEFNDFMDCIMDCTKRTNNIKVLVDTMKIMINLLMPKQKITMIKDLIINMIKMSIDAMPMIKLFIYAMF